MTSSGAMIILRRFKDIDAGTLPTTPSLNNPNMTVKDVWYLLFKAFLKTHPDTVIPDDLASMIRLEFESELESMEEKNGKQTTKDDSIS